MQMKSLLESFICKYFRWQKVNKIAGQAYGIASPRGWGLYSHEWFVVKYAVDCTGMDDSGCGQRELGTHSDGDDDTVVSYNILLNSPEAFTGGGTTIEAFDKGFAIRSQECTH